MKKLGKKSNTKIKKAGLQDKRKERELGSAKKFHAEKEAELNQLREQIKYKNQRLAMKDLEMENYKKVMEEQIFQLEAKIKELEAKLGRRFPASG